MRSRTLIAALTTMGTLFMLVSSYHPVCSEERRDGEGCESSEGQSVLLRKAAEIPDLQRRLIAATLEVQELKQKLEEVAAKPKEPEAHPLHTCTREVTGHRTPEFLEGVYQSAHGFVCTHLNLKSSTLIPLWAGYVLVAAVCCVTDLDQMMLGMPPCTDEAVYKGNSRSKWAWAGFTISTVITSSPFGLWPAYEVGYASFMLTVACILWAGAHLSENQRLVNRLTFLFPLLWAHELALDGSKLIAHNQHATILAGYPMIVGFTVSHNSVSTAFSGLILLVYSLHLSDEVTDLETSNLCLSSLVTLVIMSAKEQSAQELVNTGTELASSQIENSRYDRLLKSLSHDFKGTLVAILAEVEVHNLHNSMIESLMHHVAHSMESLKYRSVMVQHADKVDQTTEPLMSALAPLAFTLQKLFPVLKVPVDISGAVQFVPCLFHTACYQIVRNGIVHGGGEVNLVVRREAGFAFLSFINNPGQNHQRMLSLGDKALDFALSGQAGIMSSSGLGLRDIMDIVSSQKNCEFSLQWEADRVVATLKVPVCSELEVPNVAGAEDNSDDQGVQDIRVCVIDDQLGPRLTATRLIPLVNPNTEYTPPKERRDNKGVWQDELVKVGGLNPSDIDECIEWANLEPRRTIVFLDRMLEFPCKAIDGLDLIPTITANGAMVIMRSGNDSDKDRELYLKRGAFGSVGKVLQGCREKLVIQSAREHIFQLCS